MSERVTNQLPKNWITLPLSEVIQTQKGKKPHELGEKSEYRNIPYINIKAFEKRIITEYAPEQEAVYCTEKDILVVWDGARAGLSGRGISGYVGSTLAKITSDLVDTDLLAYFFESVYIILNTQTKGVGIPHINPVVLNNLPFNLPPKNEQTRIVDKLEELFSELDEGVKELKLAQTKLIQYRQSLLKSAVEGSLIQQWRAENHTLVQETGKQLLERILKQRREQWQQQKLAEFAEKGKSPPKNWQDKYPEPVQPDTTGLPELPLGWAWATVDQCTIQTKDITDGPFGSNLKTKHYTKSGPRVIRLQNIGDGVFLNDKAHISEEHFASLSKHAVECGDILVAMMGESLPRACIVPSGVVPAIVKADSARIRVNSEMLNSKLLSYYLNSSPIKKRTKSAVKGVGRPRINLGYIRSIVIPLPSVIEQKVIADKIDTEFYLIDQQIKATTQSLKQSEVQKINILKSAFSGQLVHQNPNDEPASVLLKTIRLEREKLVKTPKFRNPNKPKKKINVMKTLLEVLTVEDDWIDAQEAFKKCGIVDGTSTDRIEEIYAELRKLEKIGEIGIQRYGNYDQLKLITKNVKEK